MREAMECGEKAVYIVDPTIRDSHEDHLKAGGVVAAEGQLEILTWFETYLVEDQHFDPAKMLATVEGVMRAGLDAVPTVALAEDEPAGRERPLGGHEEVVGGLDQSDRGFGQG